MNAPAARRPCDRVVPLQDCLAVAAVGLCPYLLPAHEPLRVSSGSLSPCTFPGTRSSSTRSRPVEPTDAGRLVVFRDPQHHELDVELVVTVAGHTMAIEDAGLGGTRNPTEAPTMPCSRSTDRAARAPSRPVEGRLDLLRPGRRAPDAVSRAGDNRTESIEARTGGPSRSASSWVGSPSPSKSLRPTAAPRCADTRFPKGSRRPAGQGVPHHGADRGFVMSKTFIRSSHEHEGETS